MMKLKTQTERGDEVSSKPWERPNGGESRRPAGIGAAQEYLPHCSGVSMTADALEAPMNPPLQRISFTPAVTDRRYNASHSHRRSQTAATTHLMHIGGHRPPLQRISCASAVTDRRLPSQMPCDSYFSAGPQRWLKRAISRWASRSST